MYNYIRHSLTAIELHRRAIEDGRDLTPKLTVIQKKGGLTVYTGVSKKNYESIRAYSVEKTKTNGRRELTLEEKVKKCWSKSELAIKLRSFLSQT